MKKISLAILAVSLFTLIASEALADTIICRDGTRYKGIIIFEDEDTVVLEIPSYPIRLTVFRGSIAQIQPGSKEENAELKKEITRAKEQRGFVE